MTRDKGQGTRQKGKGKRDKGESACGRSRAIAGVLVVVALASVSLLAQRPSPDPRVIPAITLPPLTQQPPAGTPPPQLEGFVRADQLPQKEQLPAAPLVIAAYAVAWIAIFLYVWSIWHRLNRVERELADVTRRVQPGARR